MLKYSGVLVVEGKTDRDHISKFLNCDIITTNGSEISCETLKLIGKLAGTRNVIVLTDPDAPGKRIRDIVNHAVPGVLNAYIPRDKAVKKGKLGVAECPPKYILEALEHVMPAPSARPDATLSFSDLVECGLAGNPGSSDLRNKVSLSLHLGEGNAKTFLSRANACGLSKAELLEAIERVS